VLRATNGILNGPPRASTVGLADASLLEKVPLVVLLGCILAMGLFPGRIAGLLDEALLPILHNLNR
jgi:NADH-quinone oxidoreductase subunit M